ncbi:MAG: hypothetical protein MUD16_02560 [Desulfobacterales bacterium]|jgi:hypothetical protein|nr:hypothetical protein [Desulfobacterales bacterium]
MLKPVYFPFTHLGDRAAAALQSHFDVMLLLRPFAEGLPPGMRGLERCGFLEILACDAGDEVSGAEAAAGFLEWARRHAGGVGPTGAFWQARLAGGPAGGDRSAFQLASQIKRRCQAEEPPNVADPLRAARVFLRLAQELDEQNEEVLRELMRVQTLRAEMLAAMDGRPPSPAAGAAAGEPLPPTGREEHRLTDRLSAWARLFLAAACPGPVLVTTRAAVVAHLIEASAAVRRLPLEAHRGRGEGLPAAEGAPAALRMEALADWAAAPAERIATLPLAGPGEAPVPGRGGLSGCLFPDDPPHRLLGRFAAVAPPAQMTASQALVRHTIVLLVELGSDSLL